LGEESKLTEFEKGNTEPMKGPLKPSTAESLEESSPEFASVPKTEDELPRTEEADRVRRR
jgi:hypothetical protein